jgi:hypothetical protein
MGVVPSLLEALLCDTQFLARRRREQICYWYYHTVGSYHTVVELGHKMTSCCPPLTDTVYSTVPLSRVRTRIDFFASRLTPDMTEDIADVGESQSWEILW